MGPKQNSFTQPPNLMTVSSTSTSSASSSETARSNRKPPPVSLPKNGFRQCALPRRRPVARKQTSLSFTTSSDKEVERKAFTQPLVSNTVTLGLQYPPGDSSSTTSSLSDEDGANPGPGRGQQKRSSDLATGTTSSRIRDWGSDALMRRPPKTRKADQASAGSQLTSNACWAHVSGKSGDDPILLDSDGQTGDDPIIVDSDDDCDLKMKNQSEEGKTKNRLCSAESSNAVTVSENTKPSACTAKASGTKTGTEKENCDSCGLWSTSDVGPVSSSTDSWQTKRKRLPSNEPSDARPTECARSDINNAVLVPAPAFSDPTRLAECPRDRAKQDHTVLIDLSGAQSDDDYDRGVEIVTIDDSDSDSEDHGTDMAATTTSSTAQEATENAEEVTNQKMAQKAFLTGTAIHSKSQMPAAADASNHYLRGPPRSMERSAEASGGPPTRESPEKTKIFQSRRTPTPDAATQQTPRIGRLGEVKKSKVREAWNRTHQVKKTEKARRGRKKVNNKKPGPIETGRHELESKPVQREGLGQDIMSKSATDSVGLVNVETASSWKPYFVKFSKAEREAFDKDYSDNEDEGYTSDVLLENLVASQNSNLSGFDAASSRLAARTSSTPLDDGREGDKKPAAAVHRKNKSASRQSLRFKQSGRTDFPHDSVSESADHFSACTETESGYFSDCEGDDFPNEAGIQAVARMSSEGEEIQEEDSGVDLWSPLFAKKTVGTPYTVNEFVTMWNISNGINGTTTEKIERKVRKETKEPQEQYGRVLFLAMNKIFKRVLKVRQNSCYLDIGHGIGNTCLQASYTYGCRSRGIECEYGRNVIALNYQFQLQDLAAIHRERGMKFEPGEVEFIHGKLQDPAHRKFLVEEVDVAFCNNFGEVFKRGSLDLDRYVAGIFAMMKPGAVLATLFPLNGNLVHLSLKQSNEKRRERGLDESDNASFFERSIFYLGPQKDVASWSKGGSCEHGVIVNVYTRTKQSAGNGQAVFLCNNTKCKNAKEGTPIKAVRIDQFGGPVIGCCECRISERAMRERNKNLNYKV